MVLPLTEEEQRKVVKFRTDQYIAVYYSTSLYNAVWKIVNDEVKQAVPDLNATKSDIETFKEPMRHYGITYSGPDNMYDMDNPTQ